jgi:hypothetical protein
VGRCPAERAEGRERPAYGMPIEQAKQEVLKQLAGQQKK